MPLHQEVPCNARHKLANRRTTRKMRAGHGRGTNHHDAEWTPQSKARPRADLNRDRWSPSPECQTLDHEADWPTPLDPDTKPNAITHRVLPNNGHFECPQCKHMRQQRSWQRVSLIIPRSGVRSFPAAAGLNSYICDCYLQDTGDSVPPPGGRHSGATNISVSKTNAQEALSTVLRQVCADSANISLRRQ